jgi:hypothetical protein
MLPFDEESTLDVSLFRTVKANNLLHPIVLCAADHRSDAM